MHPAKLIASAAAMAIAVPGLAVTQAQAQQQQQQTQTQASPATGDQQIAEECLANSRDVAARIQQDEYWIGGWGTRWGYGTTTGLGGTPTGATTPGTMATTPGTTATAPPAGTAPATAPGAAPPAATPWGTAGTAVGMMSPRHQVSALYNAANVLAYRGDEQGCQYMLEELNAVYEEHVSRLREAGVDPSEVTTWRQEQMTLAQPVTELPRQLMSIDNLSGMNVRNPRDELLGSVDDVILDEQSGSISHLIVEHGGFLGIGQNHVLVPWEAFAATPGLNLLVLDVTEEQFENAPEIDPDIFTSGETFTARTEDIGRYWTETGVVRQ